MRHYVGFSQIGSHFIKKGYFNYLDFLSEGSQHLTGYVPCISSWDCNYIMSYIYNQELIIFGEESV